MVLKRTWQRGTADLVALGVGMMILGIVTAGTTAAMVYGREMNIRNEHYKVAAYKLRAAVEETIGKLSIGPGSGTVQYWRDVPENLRAKTLKVDSLDMPHDFGETKVVKVTITQDKIVPVYSEVAQDTICYEVTLRAKWQERDMAAVGLQSGQINELAFRTAVVIRGKI
jgi:hypothetical protein